MTLHEAIQKALLDPHTALTGCVVAEGPDGDFDYFFRGTPPHHYEDGTFVRWDLSEAVTLQIPQDLAAEAQGMDEDELTQLMEVLEMQAHVE